MLWAFLNGHENKCWNSIHVYHPSEEASCAFLCAKWVSSLICVINSYERLSCHHQPPHELHCMRLIKESLSWVVLSSDGIFDLAYRSSSVVLNGTKANIEEYDEPLTLTPQSIRKFWLLIYYNLNIGKNLHNTSK